MHKNTWFIIVLVVAVVLGGLSLYMSQYEGGVKKNIDNNMPVVEAKSLFGRDWVWQTTKISDGTKIVPNMVDRFTINFNVDGGFSGSTDCNSYFGTYELNQSIIKFGPIGSTKMFCDGSQENQYLQMVHNTTSYEITGEGKLVLVMPYDSGYMEFVSR